ncbi:unnamed protein product [Closterium sp. Naga37s-1]|nr:unnamed protein product [Closterium sp. Naga37s-1]
MARLLFVVSFAVLLAVASAGQTVVTGPNKPAVNLDKAKGDNGVASEVPSGIEKAAAAGNLDKFEGTTIGVEVYVKGNPLTLKKASPQTCCNTCAGYSSCTYWQYIPDITIDGKKTDGACYLVHDNIDYSCGELTAQYVTDSKPIALQVR